MTAVLADAPLPKKYRPLGRDFDCSRQSPEMPAEKISAPAAADYIHTFSSLRGTFPAILALRQVGIERRIARAL